MQSSSNLVVSLILIAPVVKCEVGFILELNVDELVFGETLVINMTISTSEHIQDQTLEVRLSPHLLFSASIHSQTCDLFNKNCTTASKTIKDSELSNTGKFVFDNRVIDESKQLIVFNDTSSWEPGYFHQTVIELTNVASTDLSGREFVVGVFRYWDKPRLNNKENGVQNFDGRNFTLYPARIYLLIDGKEPNKTGDLNKIFSGVEKSLTIVASTDPRAGTMLMKIELPSVSTGNCVGTSSSCNSTIDSSTPVLNVIKATYSQNQGKGSNQEMELVSQPLVSNVALMDSNSLVVTPEMMTDATNGTCIGLCRMNLTLVTLTADQYVKSGQELNISGAVYYGPNLEYKFGTPPVFFTVIGPDLDLVLVANPSTDLEAGMEVRLQATLKHSNTSTEDLVVPKVYSTVGPSCNVNTNGVFVFQVAFTFPNEDAVKLIFGTAALSKNGGPAAPFNDANITQGVIVGDFPLGSLANITFRVTLTDALPLAAKLPIKVGADFGFKRASDACLPAPCLHGGTCVPASNGQPAKCQCTPDFDGVDCSKRVCKRGAWKTPLPESWNLEGASTTCYHFPDKVLPFSSAVQECAQLGANLLSIHSAASDIWALASYWLNTLQNISEVWIGLHRDSSGSNWKWSDGLPVNLADWYDDNQRNGPGNCVIASSAPHHNYRWLSRDCTLGYYFFCADPPKAVVGGPRAKSRNEDVKLMTKVLKLNTKLGLGDKIRIQQPITITVNFSMPLGTLENAQLETAFKSTEVDPIPIVFVASDLTLPQSVNCSRPNLLHATVSDFLVNVNTSTITRHRAKRAAPVQSGHLSMIRPMGTLVNSVNGGQSGAPISVNLTFLATGPAGDTFSGANVTMDSSLVVNDVSFPVASKEAMFAQAQLIFNKSFEPNVQSPGQVLVTATVSHAPTSTGPVYDLNYVDDLECLRVRQVPKDATYESTCKEIRVKRSQLDVGEKMVVNYAISADKGMDYEPSFRNATINYTSIQPGEFLYQEYPGQRGAMEVSTCIFRKDDVMVMDRAHMHLYSTLAFFLAILLSTVVVLAMHYFLWRSKRRRLNSATDEEKLMESGDDTKSEKSEAAVGLFKRKGSKGGEVQSQGVDVGTMTGDAQGDETIVSALIEPGPQQMYRRINRMDVRDGVAMEEQLNATKLQNMLDCTASVSSILLPDPKLSDELTRTMKKRTSSACRNMEQNYKIELETLRKTSKIKNGDRLGELQNKHSLERKEVATAVEEAPETEKETILNSLKSIQKAEYDELVHKLLVEQEIELQRLSEELQAKKESFLLELQAQLVKEMALTGKVDIEQAESLSQELEKSSSEIIRWFYDERAHQRALLDETCQLRRHLAMQKELWDQQYDESFETLIKQYFDAVEYLIKRGLINESEWEESRQEAKKQIKKMKEWLERERRSRETKLEKATAVERKKIIGELKSQQQKDLEHLTRALKERKSTDALEVLREIQKKISDQRHQLRTLENKLDEESANQLNKTYSDLETEFAQILEDKKRALLKQKNLPEQDSQNLLSEHKDHMKILAEKHEFQRQKQSGKLKEVLEQLKVQAAEQAEKEAVDQVELRQHEKSVARILIDQQASLSDADREKLARLQLEHLANMKNGLALNRLHQIQMLEKKLTERKAGLMERLERRRHTISKPASRTTRARPRTGSSEQAGSSSLSSGDERKNQTGSQQQMSLLEYTQQRLHIARDTTLNIEKEIETLRQSLLPQRAYLLKEREEQLGALVAQLQIEKAKQIVDLEQQEDALANLTTCMVEDLNERGVLSNPDCHRILEKHQVEQQRLSERLQEQKEKQDLVLQHQLQERASKKKVVLEKKQKELTESRPITAVQHIDSINMIHDYALEREKLVQQTERELEQALQEQRRQFEMTKRQALQDQEIDLINNLVQMGNFNKSEVSGVLRMLFPDKTKQEVKVLAKKVYKVATPNVDDAKERRASISTQNSLAKRLEKTSQVQELIEERASDSSPSPGIAVRRKRASCVRVQYPRPRSRPRTHLPPISRRPEPVGASVDQVAEYLPNKRIARVPTAQVTAPRQTYHQ